MSKDKGLKICVSFSYWLVLVPTMGDVEGNAKMHRIFIVFDNNLPWIQDSDNILVFLLISFYLAVWLRLFS